MSSPRWRFGVLVLALVTIGAGPLNAQGRAERQARLREQIRVLEARVDVARAAHERATRQGRGELTDTVVAGTLVILTRPDMRARVRDGANVAWSRVRSALGPDTVLAAQDTYVVVSGPLPALGDGQMSPLRFGRDADATEIERALLFRIEQDLLHTMQSSVRGWFAPGAIDSIKPSDLRAVYVELVTAPAPAGRDCFLGRLDGCREYFGLRGDYDPLERWYSAAERVRRGQSLGTRLRQRERERWDPAFEPCLTDADEAACVAILRSTNLPAGRGPASLRARRTLEQLAVQLGGRGAFGHLLTARDTSVEGRLEAAAGLPMDSLLTRWRHAVIARSEDRPQLTRTTAWVALIWVALFGAIAGRSSRWGRG